MSAPNFLGLRCPCCGDAHSIDICAEVWVRVTADGTDADAAGDGSHDYTPQSPAMCGACGHCGQLEDFERADFDNLSSPEEIEP
jgi:hypothetical protein